MISLNNVEGCLLGLAIGDALGTTVEFSPPGSFKPMTDLVGGGSFYLKAGQWTDDTSMALCLATSLAELQVFDPADQMRRYLRWFRDGYLSSTGHCFDIGNTTREALVAFENTGEPYSGSTDPQKAGNGCLMRLAAIPIFFSEDITLAIHFSEESSRTTHGAVECLDATRLFSSMLVKALYGSPKEEILTDNDISEITSPAIVAIAKTEYFSKTIDEIVGSGYVVRSLEAALWCFQKSESYKDAVLMAANLGNDADTTASICGQIAGAYYGREGIPTSWQDMVFMKKEILALAKSLLHHTPYVIG